MAFKIEKLRIGARGSKLSIAQVQEFINLLKQFKPDLKFEIITIRTKGDVDRKTPLYKMSEKGVFFIFFNKALLNGEVDVAVHSAKDLPVDYEGELVLAAVPPRKPPYDVLVAPNNNDIYSLPQGAVVGTSSLRRICFLKYVRRDLKVKPIRGNVDTRLSKLERGEYGAIILAEAGIKRLNLKVKYQRLDPETFIPAAGQGALAVLVRRDRSEIIDIVKKVDDFKSRVEVLVEKEIISKIGAGCKTPIGVHASFDTSTGKVKIILGTVTPNFNNFTKLTFEGKIETLSDIPSIAERISREFSSIGGTKVLNLWKNVEVMFNV